jgi:hypothetical protein
MTPKLNVLVAYPYMTGRVITALQGIGDKLRLVVDSGAFTAWNAGKPIELDDYCRFLETLPVTPWRYFTLDVIGDPAKTWDNYQTMLARGFKPVPILTKGEGRELLDEYYKTSDVVGIGGINSVTNKRMFVKRAMQMVGNRKVHLLGFTDVDYLKFYRPYMCDSSGYDQSRFGQIRLYMGRGRFAYVKKADLDRIDPLRQQALVSYGVTVEALRHKKAWSGTKNLAMYVNLASMVRACGDIERNLGTKQFMAETSADKIEWLATIHSKQWEAAA